MNTYISDNITFLQKEINCGRKLELARQREQGINSGSASRSACNLRESRYEYSDASARLYGGRGSSDSYTKIAFKKCYQALARFSKKFLNKSSFFSIKMAVK